MPIGQTTSAQTARPAPATSCSTPPAPPPAGSSLITDNRDGEENTRALGFTLDPEGRTLHCDNVIDLGRSCSRSLGASHALEGGNVVTTRGNRALVQEFTPDEVEPWGLRFDCGTEETGCGLDRAIPVPGL